METEESVFYVPTKPVIVIFRGKDADMLLNLDDALLDEYVKFKGSRIRKENRARIKRFLAKI